MVPEIEHPERTTRMDSDYVEMWVGNYATFVMGTCGLLDKGWTIKFLDENKNLAGQVFHTPKLITFSRDIIFDTRWENLAELVLHEIAHALCPTGDHNQQWYDQLIALGGSGRWYLTADYYKEVKVS